jgi:uncharacterized protein YifE (UPF0438 family)
LKPATGDERSIGGRSVRRSPRRSPEADQDRVDARWCVEHRIAFGPTRSTWSKYAARTSRIARVAILG